MASRMYSLEQKKKLTQIVTESINIYQEIDDLNAGISDTIKAISEEMEIKPSILKKAIKLAQKSKFTDASADFAEVEAILETVGRTL